MAAVVVELEDIDNGAMIVNPWMVLQQSVSIVVNRLCTVEVGAEIWKAVSVIARMLRLGSNMNGYSLRHT